MRALLLNVVVASAIVSAGVSMQDPVEADLPLQNELKEEGGNFGSAVMAALNEQVQKAEVMLQRFFSTDVSHDDVVRVVVIEDDVKVKDLTVERKRACMKALQTIHEQDQLQTETETLSLLFRPVVDMISLRVWGEASCDDLKRADLVQQCTTILDSKDTIKELVSKGKTDDEVCELVPIVSDLKKADTLSCKLCERFVQMVSQAMAQEVQQVQEVRAIIGDLCDAMSADSKCHTFLKNFDDIVDWLKHDTEPLVICTRISMCLSDRDSILMSSIDENQVVEDKTSVVTASAENESSCAFCSHVAGVVYHANEVIPEQLHMVKPVLGMVCATATSQSKCVEVEASFDRMVELVQLGQLPHDVCANSSFCPQDLLYDILPSSQVVGNDKSCVYCDAATTVLEVILQETPDQIDQVRDYADMICGMLGDDSPCHQYVNELDIIIDSLEKGVHPRAICKTLKYCSVEVADRPSDLDTNPRGLMEIVEIKDRTEPVMVNGDTYLPHDGCLFCSRVATVIHHVNLASPEKLPIVKAILSNICQLVPSRYNCAFVDMNFDNIAYTDKLGVRPFKACELLDVCDEKKRWDNVAPSVAFEMKGAIEASQLPIGNATQCTYCQFATTVMKVALQQYGTDIREIRLYADMICDMLGSDNPCHVYMKEFDFVIDAITKGMSSKAICTELKFCAALAPENLSSDVLASDLVLTQMVMDTFTVSTDGCTFCTELGALIKRRMERDPNATALIREVANIMCDKLSNDNQCHSFLKQLDTIVYSFQKGVHENDVCFDLMFCQEDPVPAKAKLSLPVTKNDEEDSNTCAMCSGLMAVLKHALAIKPEEVKEMREAAGIMCQLLPADDACHANLKVLNDAVSGLQAGKEPEEICQVSKLCSLTDSSRNSAFDVLDFTGKDFLPSKCTTCRQNTLLLASLIARPDSLATFEIEINSICRLIPESLDCKLLMKHKDMIIDSLKRDEDVDAVCARIANCEPAAVEKKPTSMSLSCLFCEYAADLLERAKNDDNILREAKVTLETICTVLPPFVRCDALTSKFDELVSLMREGKSPSEACHVITLCDSASVFSGSQKDDPIVQAFEKSRQSLGKIMEIE